MGGHARGLAGTGLILLVCMASFGPALGQPTPQDPNCSPTDDDTTVLCGHALAAMEQFNAGLLPTGAPMILETQDDTDITHCFLDIEILFYTIPKSIAGTNTLSVTSRTDGLTQMTLDLESGMVVDSVSLNGAPAAYTRPTDQILIDLGATYDQGDSFTVQVAYHGTPVNRTDWSTFNFFSTRSNGSPIAATFCQPWYARHWWPCKDNFTSNTDKFTLDIHVTVPDTMTAVCNGALQGVDALSGSRKKFRWRESYPIATYLVSFAATDYITSMASYNHAGGSMPVEFYSYSPGASYYLPGVVQAISTFSDPAVYGPYPFLSEKYGIAQFEWMGGMENQTVTSQRDFYSETMNTHELSHQWWGDAVTCKTWHDIWLHEGFATFSEALFKEKRPGGSYGSYINHLNSKRPDPSGTGTVYRYDISTTAAIFDYTYAYNKGAWVVHMLRHVMGDPAFAAALASYRAAFEGGSADTEDFRAACEAVYGGDLSWFFNEWVYNAGAPYYRYGWVEQQIDGQNWVLLHVEQYQKSVVSSFPAAMKMPIEILCDTGPSRRIHRIWTGVTPTMPGAVRTFEWFRLPVDGDVIGVWLDTDTKILRGNVVQVNYVSGPPRLVGMNPEPGEVVPLSQGLLSIDLHFNLPVIPALSNFTLSGSVSGPQSLGLGLNADHKIVTLSFRNPLPNGQTWTVQISDTLVGENGGVPFDGELSAPDDPAALPSGDGIPGGNATLTFAITGFAPDMDRDYDVDADDAGLLWNCLTGPGETTVPAQCVQVDFDADQDVDQTDFGYFQRCLGEPNVIPAETCLGL